MNKKKLYRTISAVMLLLSTGTMTVYAETNGITYRYIDGSSYTYNSQGILTITNEQDNSQSVVIDTNDIYANAEAIEEIQKKLIGLGGGNLGYDNTSNTYYIDIDGDRTLNESVDVLIGAVGTAARSMVLEGYTFSSQEAGVNKQGEMVDVLSHNNVLTAGVYTPSGSDSDLLDGSISLSEGGATLSTGATNFNVGIGESVTLPTGYYGEDTVINNGVKDNGNVLVSLSKETLTASLGAGYYQSITVDTEQAYIDGFIEGKAQTTTKNVYNTVVVSTGSNGTFADGSKADKTFKGPAYTGLDLNIIPNVGYMFDRWDVSVDKTNIKMTALYKKQELQTKVYNGYISGEQNFGDMKLTEISFDLVSNVEEFVYSSNDYKVAKIDMIYDVYVNDQLYKSIAIKSTGKIDEIRNPKSGNYINLVISKTSASGKLTFDTPTGNVKVVCRQANYAGAITADMTVKGY